MDLNTDQKELVESFVEQEFLIGTLYKLFARRYPEQRDFWAEMANEEYQHASIIKRITESDPNNEIAFLHGELRSNSLVSSMNYIKSLTSEFRDTIDFPIIKAVGIALHIEKALWEKNIFQYFEGDSEDVKRIMISLHLEQEIHIAKLSKFAMQFQWKDR
ncbi:MAG: hypothetical protein PHY09_11210 [Desulfuromonadaceae bacterium]|nr:hypothetical protein [Desulfuromonadaceae bacterium]MDD5106143.1 hypothetical protein [Desulfuromonadaceae bacterium]